jgi:UDP-N-acetyl-D-glucosamine dehydrogenase
MTTATESRLAALKHKMETREARIGIIGMGYVGLPLSLLFSAQRFRVTGFDIEGLKVATLNSGPRRSRPPRKRVSGPRPTTRKSSRWTP